MSSFNFAVLVLTQLLCLRLEFAAQSQVKETKRGTATVSGQVVLNGAPLSDVTVVLRPQRPTSREEAKGVEAKSDDDGIYRITDVAAGHYYINVLTPGFVVIVGAGADLRGKILTIAAGEKLENINFELRREGVITGRVTNSNGDPVVREWVELIKLGDDGKPQPSPFNPPDPRMTDERGVYRITGLPEGRYLVSVGVSPEESGARRQYRTSSYPKTFYPGAPDQSQAKAVEVKEGFENADVDISGVVAKKAYEISGRVVHADTGEPAEGVMVFYGAMSKDRGVISGWRPSKERSNTEGEFQIQGVAPGKYAVYANTLPKRELFSDPVIYEIADGGIQGVELRIHRGGSISGAVVIEGSNDATRAKLSQLQIIGYQRLERPYIPLGGPTGLNADGSFRIEGLQSGKVNLSLIADQKLGGFLVKRVERDGVQQPDGIEISPGENVSNVRVVVEYGNLTLRGEVKIVGGKLPPGRWIYANATRLNESQPRACGADVDARGQFIFENLLPGEYEVRLVSLVYQPGEPQDKGLSKLISGVRQKVSLGAAGHAPITLVVDLGRKEGDQ
jgi:protocatechuate 3,4-dioxygenase beta subunit